jgi:hypothetical protein
MRNGDRRPRLSRQICQEHFMLELIARTYHGAKSRASYAVLLYRAAQIYLLNL